MPLQLSTPVKFIKRIGERVAAGLAERGVLTVEDLLYHLPFRYEDRLHPKPLSMYQPGDMASLVGEVRGTVLLRTRSGPIFEMTVGITRPDADSDAAMQGLLSAPPPLHSIATRSPSPSTQDVLETVKCMWFHGTYLKDKFRPGQKIALYGKLEGSRSGNALNAPPGSTRFKMIQPTFEILPDAPPGSTANAVARRGGDATGEDAEFTMLEMGRIVPVYESLGGKTPWGAKLTSRWMRRVMWTIFRDLEEAQTVAPDLQWTGFSPSIAQFQSIGALAPEGPNDTLPAVLRERLSLPTRMDALRDLHFPAAGTSMTDLISARTPAHRRLIFEEFWYLELGLELKRRRMRERAGKVFVTNDSVREALKQVLPFKPTAAQKRVLGEIVNDMRGRQPMRRLLQGDVGSGKTIVAFQAALVAIENGCQVAMMAPTEILATQHYLSARKLLSDKISPYTKRPYRIALLTGSLDDRTKRETRGRIVRGEIDLAIGTHALVEEKVDFANLGLVIVDEQHRFGVQQRFQLMRKTSPQTGYPDPSGPGFITSSKNPGALAPSIADDRSRINPPSAQDLGAPSVTASSSRVGSLNAQRSPSSTKTTTQSPPTDAQSEPDVLVMTATPIPRTLALTLYGDLEASVIDELPPGRTPIQTRRMPEERSSEVWDFVRKQVTAGRQAYIVYPVIEGEKDDQPELDFAADPTESSKNNADIPEITTAASANGTTHDSLGRSPRFASMKKTKRAESPAHNSATKPKRTITRIPLRSATEMYAQLQSNELASLKLGLLHGRMSADDKEVTMARFKRGEIDVLVSTTVIEVGVDVPNATVMVIEHAERFGLAQLHQLRGRVGRGAAKSYCVLLTGEKISPEAEQRLDAMVQTQDGFALAEIDLQQRGPGEFFGTRQAGLPEFRVANLARDRDLLELAKVEAARFVDSPDPTMPRPEIDAVWSRLKHQWQRRYGLLEA